MIKVNVLSFQRRSKRQQKRGFSGQASLLIGAALTVLAILGLWSMALHYEYKTLITEKEVKVAELAELKEKSQQTEILESTYKALLTRARLLEHQSGRKFVPVSLMDSISRSLTPLSLWLLRVGVDGTNVEIEGRGLQSEDILKFVDTLEQALFWENLLAVEMQKESYQSIPVYRFTLRFTLNLETAVGSQKSAQALDAPGKIKKASSPQR